MRTPARVLIAVAGEGGTVRLHDGATWSSGAITRKLDDTLVLTNDVRAVVTRIGRRPLGKWRFWHHRYNLVRAHRAGKALVRDWCSLGEWLPRSRPIGEELGRVWLDVQEIRDWCETRAGVPFKPSASAVGVELLSRRFKPNFPPLYTNLTEEELVRPALYGGMVQVFPDELDARGYYAGDVIGYDANGAYLDVLRSVRLPYPYRFIPGAYLGAEGVSAVTIEERDGIPILPERDAGYRLGRKTGVWTNRELRYALDHGARLLAVHGGMQYVGTTPALLPLGEWLAEERERATPGAVKVFLKRVPNALIGRFATRPSVCVNHYKPKWRELARDPWVLSALPIAQGIVSVELARRRRSPWYASAWAIAITAEQRLRLHAKLTALKAEGYRPLYCDTDGVILGLNGRPLPPASATIGAYKIEWQGDALYVQGGKAYVAGRRELGAVAVKRAGVPRETPLGQKFPNLDARRLWRQDW